MLGELGTEQFEITIEQDGKLINRKKISDPFITCTVITGMSRWYLFKAMFRTQFTTTIRVTVSGTMGIMRAIMMLDPKETEKAFQESFNGSDYREVSETTMKPQIASD